MFVGKLKCAVWLCTAALLLNYMTTRKKPSENIAKNVYHTHFQFTMAFIFGEKIGEAVRLGVQILIVESNLLRRLK